MTSAPTTEPRRPGQCCCIACLGTILALSAGLMGCTLAPPGGPVPPVLDVTPGVRIADGRPV